jgi:hypothetical protein
VKAPRRASAALALALFPASTLLALHFRDGPPARVTGGFGEDSCAACHAGAAPNDAAGKLALEGLPDRLEPGATYPLEVTLSYPGMAVGGFQLAFRNGDRSQAGRIAIPAAEESRVAILEERGVQFAQHKLAAEPADGDTLRWALTWTAPDAPGAVTAHVSAVAGDGDESQAGDYVFTLEAAASPSPGGARPRE